MFVYCHSFKSLKENDTFVCLSKIIIYDANILHSIFTVFLAVYEFCAKGGLKCPFIQTNEDRVSTTNRWAPFLAHWPMTDVVSERALISKAVGPRYIIYIRHSLNIPSLDIVGRWHVLSRQQENLPEVRLLVNSWPLKPLERVHRPPVESRSPTDTGPELLLFVKSGDTRKAQSCWSGNSHSSVWSVRSLRISKPTCASRVPLSWPCRRLARPTSSDYLRIPTCAPFTPRE